LGEEVLLGDVNRDATVDFADISPFIALLTSPSVSQLSFANSIAATSDPSTLTVPLSASNFQSSSLAGSIANNNNGQNQPPNLTDKFYLELADDGNLDEAIDRGNDALDALILSDRLESSEAIDDAFAQLDL